MRKLNEEEVSALGGVKLRYKEVAGPTETPTPDMPSAVDNSTKQSSKAATPFGEMQQMQNPLPGDSWFDKFKSGHVTNMNRAFEFAKGMAKSVTALPTEAAEFGKDISNKFGETKVGKTLSAGIGSLAEGSMSPETAESLKRGQGASTEGSFITETSNDDQAAGKLAGEVAQALVPVGGGAKAASLGGKLAKVLNVGDKGTKIISGVARLGGEVAENALQSGVQSGSVEQAKDAGIATAIAGGLAKPLGWASDKLGNFFYSGVIPSTIAERAKDMRRMIDMGDTVSQTGISFTRGGLQKKLENVASTMGDAINTKLDDFVASNPGAKMTMKDLAGKAREGFTDKKLMQEMGLSPLEIAEAKKSLETTLKGYEKLYGNKPLDAKAIQEFKQSFNPALKSEYKKAEMVIRKASKYAEHELQSAARTVVEEFVPEVGKLNQKFAPVLEGLGRLKAKGGYSGVLTDVIAGSMNAGSAGDFLSDPVSYSKNFVTGVLLKRLGTSTLGKTFAGKVSKDVGRIVESPSFYKAVGNVYAKIANKSNKKED